VPFTETPVGAGAWLVCDDFRAPALRERLLPLLGRPDELRYLFGSTEVIFRQAGAGLTVQSRALPQAAPAKPCAAAGAAPSCEKQL